MCRVNLPRGRDDAYSGDDGRRMKYNNCHRRLRQSWHVSQPNNNSETLPGTSGIIYLQQVACVK